jgi:hypothetical protein
LRHILVLAAVTLLAPAARSFAGETCASLLTATEIEAAAGKGFEDMGPTDRGEGQSECPWMSRAGGFKLVAVTFWDGKTAADYEADLAAMEEAVSAKREVLAGMGGGAALVKNAEQLVAVVRTAGGFARVVTNGLTKAQVTALAKAVAGPAATGGGAAAVVKSERIEGAAILAHPIGALAVRYATALRAKGGDVAALSSRAAQDRRQSMPKSERVESDAFVRKMVPDAAGMEAAIRAGGILLVEGPKATLNLVRAESTRNADGSVSSSSTTSAIPFALENGGWKVAQ